MSVTTTSDEKLNSVREHLRLAHAELIVALSPDTWGYDQYNKEYTEQLFKVLNKLVKLRSKV